MTETKISDDIIEVTSVSRIDKAGLLKDKGKLEKSLAEINRLLDILK